VKARGKQLDCAVTATGIQNSISHFFQPDVFAQVSYLCNMGTDDERGENFPEKTIMFKNNH
jgi:hypothetical protein